LFCGLTEAINGMGLRFSIQKTPHFGNVVLKRFDTRAQTNWHYECAKALIKEKNRFVVRFWPFVVDVNVPRFVRLPIV
jgi:hypothetical protein